MKNTVFLLILATIILLGTACEKSTKQPASETVSHACESFCPVCGLCADNSCTETPCLKKCTGHPDVSDSFTQGDYITTENVSIDTGALVFDICQNIYVPGNLEQMGNSLSETMEQVTGLTLAGAGFANDYADGKVHINVTRIGLYDGQEDYYGLITTEFGKAYASPREHVLISSGDLFLGNSKAIAHELAHVLMYRQSEWNHSQLLNEGFAEYTTYRVMQEMDKLGTGFYMDRPTQCLLDTMIFDYEQLYSQPLEYWFDHTFAYGTNDNYCIGFHFMAYLDQVYGDYSSWITAFEETFPCGGKEQNSSVNQQIQVLKAVYGDDVLDQFYLWLRNNEAQFSDLKDFTDMRTIAAESICLYPEYNSVESTVRITSFSYDNLYISIDHLRRYIQEYKGEDASNLMLFTSQSVPVELYYIDGSCTATMTNSETTDTPIGVYLYDPQQGANVYREVDTVLSLENVSYIKLVGEGTLELLTVLGDFTVTRTP